MQKVNSGSSIPIHKIYRAYTPPINAEQVVFNLLRSVPEKFLRGLSCIVLTNQAGLSRKHRVGKVWRRDKKISKDKIACLYHPRWQGEPPWIELYVDRIFLSARRAPLWIPLVRDTVLGMVFYHELAHHIHYEIRPQYKEKEDAADNWSQRLILNHVKQTYWYLMPILVPAAKLYRLLKRRPKN